MVNRNLAPVRWDTTAGNAAYMWDSNNAREQLVYGDTGWRDVMASLGNQNGWVLISLLVRRVGWLVEVSFSLAATGDDAATTDAFATLPLGFRPSAALYRTSTLGGTIQVANTGTVGVIRPVTTSIYSYAAFTTTEPWPTTLPGVASGGIPVA